MMKKRRPSTHKISQGHVVESQSLKEKRWRQQRLTKMMDAESNAASNTLDVAELEPQVLDTLKGIVNALENRKSLYGHDISLDDLASVFAAFDRDGEGTLDIVEFEDGLKRLGLAMSPYQLAGIYDAIGQGGKTEIYYGQFATLLQSVKKEMAQEVVLTSSYRGVFPAPRNNGGRKWVVKFKTPAHLSFRPNSAKAVFIGHFDDEILAAKAYDRAAIERLGPLDAADVLNFSESLSATQYARFAKRRAQRGAAKEASKNAILFTLGKALAQKRTMYGHPLKNVRDLFSMMDRDSSGTIEADELGNALKRLGLNLSKKQVYDLVTVMDSDSNGRIDFEEFERALRRGKQEYAESLKRLRGTNVQSLLKRKKRFLKEQVPKEERLRGWDPSVYVPPNTEFDELALPILQLRELDGAVRSFTSNLEQISRRSTSPPRGPPRPRPPTAHAQSTLRPSPRSAARSLQRPQTTPQRQSAVSARFVRRRESSTSPKPQRVPSPRLDWNDRFFQSELDTGNDPSLHLMSLTNEHQLHAIPGHGALENPRDLADRRHFRNTKSFHMMNDLIHKDDEESDWDRRAVLTASSHNRGRHPSYRQYFDRPILLDETGNLQLHHRHLSIRSDEETVKRMKPEKAVLSFRGLRISEEDKPGLYEVRVEKSLNDVVEHEETDAEDAMLSSSMRFSQEENALVQIEANIGVLINAAYRATKRRYDILDLNSVIDLFDWMDMDGSGTLSASDFKTILAKRGLVLTKKQTQDLVDALDINDDDQIDFDSIVQAIKQYRKHIAGFREKRKKNSGISHLVLSKEKKEKEWRQARLDSSQKAQMSSTNTEEKERKFAEEAKQKAKLEAYLSKTEHVAYHNDALKAACLYDAALVRKFGHIEAIPFMNFPESCPQLWPKYQRAELEKRDSPYLKPSLAVSEPGRPLEDPAKHFEAIISASRRNKPPVTASGSSRTISSLNTGQSRGNKKRPNYLKRYKNANGVIVYYTQKEKRASYRKSTNTGESKKKTEITSADRRDMDVALDKLSDAISRKRSVYGHRMTTLFDAFAAFDTSNQGRLSTDDFRAALKRLGLGISYSVVNDLIRAVDEDGNGTIEYEELLQAMNDRKARKESEGKTETPH